MKYNEQLIEKMISSKRLKLNFSDSITHYFAVILMLVAPCFIIYELIEIYITKTYTGFQTPSQLMLIASPFILMAFIFFFIQHYRLKLKEVTISYTQSDFKEALRRTIKELKWIVQNNNKQYFSGYHSTETYLNNGELITIIKTKNGILINSICDPEQRQALVSFGWNLKNVNTFIYRLECVVAGIEEEEIASPESKRSYKKILVKIFLYLICLFLIGISIFIIFPGGNILMGIFTFVIGTLFLYADLTTTFKKKK